MKDVKIIRLHLELEPIEAIELLDYLNKNQKPEGAVADLYGVLQGFLSERVGG